MNENFLDMISDLTPHEAMLTLKSLIERYNAGDNPVIRIGRDEMVAIAFLMKDIMRLYDNKEVIDTNKKLADKQLELVEHQKELMKYGIKGIKIIEENVNELIERVEKLENRKCVIPVIKSDRVTVTNYTDDCQDVKKVKPVLPPNRVNKESSLTFEHQDPERIIEEDK